MARNMEWVPWDQGIPSIPFNVPAQQTFQLAALSPTQFGVNEVMGVIEDENRYFVHRIVGQFFLTNFNDEETITAVNVFFGPGRMEVEGTDAIFTMFGQSTQGGLVVGTNMTPSLTNHEFWWLRRFQPFQPLANIGGDSFEHPWWTCFDFKPKRVMEKMETPVFMVNNEDVNSTFQVRMFARMLVTRL